MLYYSGSERLLADFATRLRELRKSRNLRQIDLAAEFGVAQTTIANYEQHSRFPDEKTLRRIAGYFDVSLDFLLGRTDIDLPVGELVSKLPDDKENKLSPLARTYLEKLLAGDKPEAYTQIVEAVRGGTPVRTIYSEVFEPCLREIGRLWEISEIDVSQEHYFSAATESLMGQLYAYIERSRLHKGTVIAVAVGGELHEIGIKMIADLLEESGWSCYYVGINTPTASIDRAIVERNADVLAISATMAMNLDSVSNMISYIRTAEQRSGRRKTYIVTGGRCFNQDTGLWKRVGADGCARNSGEAVRLIDWITRNRRAS